ncbi:molybdopterin-dependent oxidoreductase [Dyella sp. C11]|uniref:molybdopterin-dependent oxidoreductase n=1 Tax=Dyella sp. C11 TaxID=2126991 RepID=UPI000D65B4DA|nr:molybdopterin-dependent oxidoreductase [Dyella sp. C11]
MTTRAFKQSILASVVLSIGLALSAHAADAPTTPAVTSVQVTVAGKPALTLDAKTFAGLPHEEVTATAHDEPPSQWKGVKLEDVLAKAGVSLDKPLRGRQLASFVRVTASDQYQVVFALSDLDPTLGHTQVLLVDQRDGKPLDKDGPFRLLVPGDKRPARWVRNVTSIEVVDGDTTSRQ